MCGRLNVTDDEFVRGLCISLGINLNRTPVMPNRFVRAASEVQINREVLRAMVDAKSHLVVVGVLCPSPRK